MASNTYAYSLSHPPRLVRRIGNWERHVCASRSLLGEEGNEGLQSDCFLRTAMLSWVCLFIAHLHYNVISTAEYARDAVCRQTGGFCIEYVIAGQNAFSTRGRVYRRRRGRMPATHVTKEESCGRVP